MMIIILIKWDEQELEWTENWNREGKKGREKDAANDDDIIDPVTIATAAAGLLHIKWSLWMELSALERDDDDAAAVGQTTHTRPHLHRRAMDG